jgi:hypothetical protein
MTYPHSMGKALLHTDCPYAGLPPHAQVMVCVEQAAGGGGETTLVDVWEVAARIREEEPDLFEALFEDVRHFRFGHADHLGPTLSCRLGNLVCIHPTAPMPGDVTGERFQRWLDRTEPVTFLARPGDVYINNNHRCVHGREAFADPRRLFKRLLVWGATPIFAAPPELLAKARSRARRLEGELDGAPRWVKDSVGATASPIDERPYARLTEILKSLAEVTNVRSLGVGGAADELTYWQDAVLSAALEVLSGEIPPLAERSRALASIHARSVLGGPRA